MHWAGLSRWMVQRRISPSGRRNRHAEGFAFGNEKSEKIFRLSSSTDAMNDVQVETDSHSNSNGPTCRSIAM